MRDEHALPGVDHVVDGVRLHVVQHGSGSGLPVLLLHGVPTSSYLWRDVQRDLGHAHRTWAVDLVGLGASERPSGGHYDLAGQAGLMLHLLDELGLAAVAVAGHGMGGALAVHVAALAPERVAALVLVDSPLHADAWPAPEVAVLAAPLVGEVQLALLRLLPDAGVRYVGTRLGRGLSGGPLSPRALAHYAEPLLTGEGAVGLLRLLRAIDPSAAESALRLVAAQPPPTLVLWGEDDAWHGPSYGRRLSGELPGSSWVPVPDAGHFLPEDRPERVAEEIEGFLAEVAPTGAGAQASSVQ